MKKFLFLYPIREYIEREAKYLLDEDIAIQRLNEIIDARYRRAGYQVYWLMFSREKKREIPDFSLEDPRIHIDACDRVITAGISFLLHKKFIYPSCRYILSQLGPATRLVIGGFHRADCVDRIARAAQRKKIPVIVDEDTTDQFFKTANIMKKLPPVTRTRSEYAADFIKFLKQMKRVFGPNMTREAIALHRAERKKRPWLVSI